MIRSAASIVSANLSRISKRRLATWLVEGIAGPDGRVISNAGPVSQVMRWRKDEIINELLDIAEGRR